jgi:hypothetical protein
MNYFKKLVELGAIITIAPDCHANRAKMIGRMWEGKAELTLNGHTISLYAWHHGPDTMTAEELTDHMSVKFIDNKDAGWNAIANATDGIWLHPTGFFYNEWLRNNPLVRKRGNPNWQTVTYTLEEQEGLESIGFVRVITY